MSNEYTLNDVLLEVEPLKESEEDKYDEIPGFDGSDADVLTMTASAVLLHLQTDDGTTDVWLPYSQLRCLEKDLYASKWILDQKGLA